MKADKIKRYNVDYQGVWQTRFGEYIEYYDYLDLRKASEKALKAM